MKGNRDAALPTSTFDAGIGFGTGGRGGTGDAATIEVRAQTPPPAINTAAIKLLPRGASLVGGISFACSFGPASTAANTRWCAFAKVGTTLGRYELWVMNMTKLPPKCDGSDSSSCVKLTDNLFSLAPQVGPKFPTAHRFFGDTLIYHADAKSAPTEPYEGPIYAWQPGWTAPKKISATDAAFQCVGVTRASMALCLENLSLDDPLSFNLTAGSIAGTPAVKQIAKIFPSHPDTMASQWGTTFTSDGKYFIYSAATPATTVGGAQGPESLYYLETEKLGTEMPKRVGDPGIAAWDIAPDYSKWFYLKDYNYSTTAPSGTLYMADFPTGANPVKIASTKIGSGNMSGIADYSLVPTPGGTAAVPAKLAFVGVLQKLTADGRGIYTQIKNPAGGLDDTTNVVDVLPDAPTIPFNSPDLRYGRYFQTTSMVVQGLTDSRIVKNADLAKCTLAVNPTSAIFGFPFLENAGLTFWVDNYDRDSDTGEGWVGDPADCVSKKRKFSSKIDYWFVKTDEQLLYTDDVEGEVSRLRVAKVVGGNLADSVVIQDRIERKTFAVLPNQEGVLFQISSTLESADGIYYYKLGAGGGASDAGTPSPDAAKPDAAAGN